MTRTNLHNHRVVIPKQFVHIRTVYSAPDTTTQTRTSALANNRLRDFLSQKCNCNLSVGRCLLLKDDSVCTIKDPKELYLGYCKYEKKIHSHRPMSKWLCRNWRVHEGKIRLYFTRCARSREVVCQHSYD